MERCIPCWGSKESPGRGGGGEVAARASAHARHNSPDRPTCRHPPNRPEIRYGGGTQHVHTAPETRAAAEQPPGRGGGRGMCTRPVVRPHRPETRRPGTRRPVSWHAGVTYPSKNPPARWQARCTPVRPRSRNPPAPPGSTKGMPPSAHTVLQTAHRRAEGVERIRRIVPAGPGGDQQAQWHRKHRCLGPAR